MNKSAFYTVLHKKGTPVLDEAGNETFIEVEGETVKALYEIDTEEVVEVQLTVRNIIGDAIDGYVRVTVEDKCFKSVKGMEPLLSYRGQGDQGGNGVRVFTFDDIELCAQYDKKSRKTMFLMKTEDAQALQMTIAQERDKAEKLPFNTSLWNRDVVATA